MPLDCTLVFSYYNLLVAHYCLTASQDVKLAIQVACLWFAMREALGILGMSWNIMNRHVLDIGLIWFEHLRSISTGQPNPEASSLTYPSCFFYHFVSIPILSLPFSPVPPVPPGVLSVDGVVGKLVINIQKKLTTRTPLPDKVLQCLAHTLWLFKSHVSQGSVDTPCGLTYHISYTHTYIYINIHMTLVHMILYDMFFGRGISIEI